MAHFNSGASGSYMGVTQVGQQQSIYLTEPYERPNGIVLNQNYYTADVYRIGAYVPFLLYDLESIVDPSGTHPGYWERHSSSTPFGPLVLGQFNTQLTPHERVKVESIEQSGVIMTGYAYHLFFNSNDMGWIPFDPTTNDLEQKAKFAFSLLVLDEHLTGQVENEARNNIALYPNPTSNNLVLNINATITGTGWYSVQTIDGRTIIQQQPLTIAKGSNQKPINTSQLPPGLYLLQCNTGNEYFNVKFIKL